MPSPTRLSSTASVWNTSTFPKTVSPSGLVAGDLLVAMVVGGDGNFNFSSFSTTAGSTSAWTTVLNIGTVSSSCRCVVGTATVTSGTTATVQATCSTTSAIWGFYVVAYRDHAGLGPNIGQKQILTPSTSTMDATFTTTSPNSSIEVVCGEWTANVTSPTTTDEREAQAGNETTTIFFAGDGSNYGVFGGVYADAGAAGSKTVGWGITRQPTLIAVEVIAGTPDTPAITPKYLSRFKRRAYSSPGRASGF